jgi:catechol 2,3-dioxygenase-like lactoylglutathione lyase family enzyme
MTTDSAIDVERVDFISVPVSDMARSTRFYEEVLGLRKAAGSGAWPEFELGNVSLILVDPAQMGHAFTAPHTAYIALRVADVQAGRELLEARGVAFERENFDTGVCHMAFFRDPDGNALMLHHRYAPYADGRLP